MLAEDEVLWWRVAMGDEEGLELMTADGRPHGGSGSGSGSGAQRQMC